MRTALIALLIAAAAVFELAPTAIADAAAPTETATRDVIVAVTGNVPSEARRTPRRVRSVKAAIRSQARSLGVTALETYVGETRYFTTRITPQQRTRMERDPSVLDIIDDDLIQDEADPGGIESADSKIDRPPRA